MPWAFILRKLCRALLTLAAIVTFVFVILRVTGDPAAQILGADATQEALEAFREKWGLNDPIWQQFLRYVVGLLRGDFGMSLVEGKHALDVVLDRLPKTMQLMGVSAVVTLATGIPIGIYAALHRGKLRDRMIMAVGVAAFSTPSFVIGILLILLMSVTLRILPTAGSDSWKHFILPVITMSTIDAAAFARLTRSAMLEVLTRPYMRTALAKGLPWHLAVRRHALPNAAIPLATIIGLFVGYLIAGGVVTENVFAWPGIGRLLVSSVQSRDSSVVQAIVLMIAASMVTVNLLVDITYGWLDPRIRQLRAES
jgi:peptide/nickel transport system permease protein